MNHLSHNQTIIDNPEVYHQSHPIILLEQPQDYRQPSFPIVQESPHQSNTAGRSESKTKLTEIKFKIESVGVHPKDDDDLDKCPARVRPGWPDKIIPWWIPINSYEKPPYSYSTLIAHAILSSKDGRLTLNDIYVWISNNYPTFVFGVGGWQNSIRHNLSLNKKWFLKIDRRPTQVNPGKGCYWALVAGTEHIFIDNLTQEGGHSRKNHDIGLTTELSLGQRRGACFYQLVGPNANSPNNAKDISDITFTGNNTLDNHGLTALPPTPTKPELSRPLLSPLYTTFRVVSEKAPECPIKKRSRRKLAKIFMAEEFEYDSGVDLGSEYVECEKIQKRCRTSSPAQLQVSYEPCDTPFSGIFLTGNNFPSTTPSYSFDWEQNKTYQYNNNDNPPHDTMIDIFPQTDWSQPVLIHPWAVPDDSSQFAYFEKHPVGSNNNEFPQKYLHFRQDNAALIQPFYSKYNLYPSNPYVYMQDILYS